MRNCGSLPKPSAALLLHPSISNPTLPTNTQLLSYTTSSRYFPCLHFLFFFASNFLPSQLFVIYLLFSLFFLHFLAVCPILNRPSVFHFLNPTPPPIPLHSLPTKFLSLWGWNEGVLNVKSLVQMLTRTGHSRCCSDQAGHSTAQAGTPLVLQKRRA